MLKIAHITRYYFPIVGGQQQYILALNKLLQRKGHETTVIQPHVIPPSKEPGIFFTRPYPLTYRLSRFVQNVSWFLFNMELNRCQSLLAAQDVLICHYAFHYPPLKKFGKKVVVLSHGVLYAQKKEAYFDTYLAAQDKKVAKEGVTIVANDTHFLRSIGIEVPVGEGYFQKVKPNVWFIPNCVDSAFFSPSADIVKKDLILVPRNIREDRGIHLAIEAFNLLAKRGNTCHLMIAGGPLHGKYFERCKELTTAYGLEEKVTFLGFNSTEHMLRLYREAKLTLIPSLEKEGTSLSALESMACGTTVVATQVAGLQDLPCVHTLPNPESVANAIENALENLDVFSEQQRKKVVDVFSISNWEEAWLNVIKQVHGKA